MSSAWVLRKKGHACTVFEKEAKAGGKVRGLTKEELPKSVLDAEIAFIERLGVKFECSTQINGIGDLEAILSEYDSVIVACKGVAKPGGKILEAKEHKLDVRAVGNGKTTGLWVDKYLKSVEIKADPKLFDSKYRKLDKKNLSKLLENKTAFDIPTIEGDLVDTRVEAGRCLH